MTSNEWIAHCLAADPPRSKSLVMTIFGDSIVSHGGIAWVSSLIDLLEPLGVNERLLRTSVFRLAQEDWLGAQREGRRSAYAIAPDARGRFERAYQRIYAAPASHWDGSWTLVIGAASLATGERQALRKELQWGGYRLIAPGVFAHPDSNADMLDDILLRMGVADQVYVCRAAELPGMARRPLRTLVGEAWDLSDVMARYDRFLAMFRPLLALLDGDAALAPPQAYVIRTLLIHAYRRVQLHDPQLPAQLLPEVWPGAQAYGLTAQLYRRVSAGAEEYVMATLRRADALAPAADAEFYRRFGGLA